jgi:hypothetical protein
MSSNILGFPSLNDGYISVKAYLKQIAKLVIVLPAFLLISCGDSDDDEGNETKSLKQITKEAYIYALPVVEHNKLLSRLATTLYKPYPVAYPDLTILLYINRILGSATIANANNTAVVSPNIDTFYTTGVLDIRYEPVVITIPPIEEKRYFSIQLLDIFTNSEYLGSVSNRTDGKYLIAHDDWNGTLPPDIVPEKVIRIPATVVLALGRIQVFDNDTIAANLTKAASFPVQTLSNFTGDTLPSNYVALSWDNTTVGYDSKEENASTEKFFQIFNYVVQYQLLSDADKKALKSFEALHLGANETFSKDNFTADEWNEIEAGVLEAKIGLLNSVAEPAAGWTVSPENAARWGEDYVTRALTAWFGIYVNTKEEALYYASRADEQGDTYNGSSSNYTITFASEPSVKYFWSLTLYKPNNFLYDNPINRYGIRSIDNITKDTNGSFTLYIQHEKPSDDKVNNWIPAPESNFRLSLRLYGETGNTTLPLVVKQN